MATIERALIANQFPLQGSGSGTYTEEVAQAIQRQGIEVKVLVIGSPGTTADLDVESIGYEDGTFPAFVTNNKQREPFRFADMSDEQIDVYVRTWREGLSKGVKTFQPSAAHLGHAWVAAAIAPSVIKPRNSIPLLTTVHGTEIIGTEADPDGRITQLAREGHKKTKDMIAVSSGIKKLAHEKLGIPLKKLHVSPNGFNPGIFGPNPDIDKEAVLRRHNLDELTDATLVYAGGRLDHVKRLDRLIGATAKAQKDVPNIHVIFCGGGDERKKQELIVYAREHGVLDRIHFLGYQPQPVLNDFANISDIGACVSDFESFGLAALETLAVGTPVVATNIGGLPDFIDDRVGRIVEPNEDAVAKALVEEITSHAKQKKGPTAARHAQGFTWDRHIEPILKLWEQQK